MSGDVSGFAQLLANDAVLYADGGGKRAAALDPIRGKENILDVFAVVLGKRGFFQRQQLKRASINGVPGFVMRTGEGGSLRRGRDGRDRHERGGRSRDRAAGPSCHAPRDRGEGSISSSRDHRRCGVECLFPAEADAAGIDSTVATIRVGVDASGGVKNVTVVPDPGHGFGREAERCARTKSWTGALDRSGLPTHGSVIVNVRFER